MVFWSVSDYIHVAPLPTRILPFGLHGEYGPALT